MRRLSIVAALLLSACTTATDVNPTPSATASSVPTLATSPSGAAATPGPTPTPVPSAAIVSFPDLPLLAATSVGQIQTFGNGQWNLEAQICPSGQANFSGAVVGFNMSADGSRAWYRCDPGGAPDRIVKAYVYDRVAKTMREIQGTTDYGLGPLSPDGRFGVLPLPGVYEKDAPISQNTRDLVDLQTGTRREILPSDYWWIEMRWTDAGLTYYRPQFGPNHNVSDPNKRGTFRWDGSSWQRISGDRVVEVRPDGSMIIERRNHLDPVPDDDRVVVVERTAGGLERELTPPGESEIALGADDRGVTAFRRDSRVESSGSFVRYEIGKQVSVLRGKFTTYLFARAGDWVVSGEPNSITGLTLYAYSLTRQVFAEAKAGIPIVALAALKPTP